VAGERKARGRSRELNFPKKIGAKKKGFDNGGGKSCPDQGKVIREKKGGGEVHGVKKNDRRKGVLAKNN